MEPFLGDPRWLPRQEAPPDPNGEQIAPAYGDRRGPLRTCRHCGTPVRTAEKNARVRTAFPVEGPIPPAQVTSKTWPAYWWHPRHGWVGRLAKYDHRHQDQELFVLHPCADHRHRPQPVTPDAPEGTPPAMTLPTFGTPKPPGSSGPSSEELAGKLLLLNVLAIETGIDTAHGTASAVRCTVVELDTGVEHDDALLFSRTLTQQLVAGTMYLGTLTKDAIGNGKTAWHFHSAADDAAAVAKAQQYLTYKASQAQAAAPTGAFVPQAAPAAAPPAPAYAPPPAAGVAAPPWAAP